MSTTIPIRLEKPADQAVKVGMAMAASVLTDPICWAREALWMMAVVKEIETTMVWARQFFYALKAALWGVVGLVPSLIGIVIRWFQKERFLALQGEAQVKKWMGSLTLLSWNVCCIPGGYSISDGGVMPWPRRFQRIVDVIREKDPDILSLQEVDTAAAFAFYEALKDRYAYFYVNIGSQAIGPSSWLFVASKFEVKNPEFVPFKKEDLHGRSKSAMKGVFSFDIDSIHIISTHLGHSEVPKTKGGPEATARKKQMEFVMSRLKDKPHALLAGDLNMGPGEFAAQNTGLSRGAVSTGMSWGGDAWCKKLSNEEISPPMNLDYIAAQGDLELSTELVETRYNGTEFNPSALSDHSGLLATVKT